MTAMFSAGINRSKKICPMVCHPSPNFDTKDPQDDIGTIEKVLVVVAMTHEALPVIERLSLVRSEDAGPMVTYRGKVGNGEVILLTNGVATVYDTNGCVTDFLQAENLARFERVRQESR